MNGPISSYCERWKAKGEKFFDLDGVDAFLDWDYAHFVKADLLSRFTAYRQAVGGPWMAVNEARRGEGMPNVENGETVQQAVNMAPLGWAGGGWWRWRSGERSDWRPWRGRQWRSDRNPADDPSTGSIVGCCFAYVEFE